MYEETDRKFEFLFGLFWLTFYILLLVLAWRWNLGGNLGVLLFALMGAVLIPTIVSSFHKAFGSSGNDCIWR